MQSAIRRSTFVERIENLLDHVEYRRADSPEEKAAIFRMRHEAYTHNGTIAPRPSGLFHDEYDESPNAWLIGAFIDGELASSIRLHASASLEAALPARMVFSDVIEPHLRQARGFIDLSRHVNVLEFSRRFPEMPYLTLRSGFLAEEYFGADYVLGAQRPEHARAFQRMFGVQKWADAREYPVLRVLMPLMAYDCKASRNQTHERYPFYRSSQAEQRRLFERSSNGVAFARNAFVEQKKREEAKL